MFQLTDEIWAISQNALMQLLGRYDGYIKAQTAGIEYTSFTCTDKAGYGDWAAGFDKEDLAAKRTTKFSRVRGSIAVVPIEGVITKRPSLWGRIFGGETSTDVLAAEMKSLVADPAVDAIVMDVNSPGGSVYGVQEAADTIYGLRGTKPIIAAVNPLAASAAYWLASAADEIVITPSGEAGSIGVVAVHYDLSKFEDQIGLKTTFIHAGKYKVEGNSSEPLGDEARQAIQDRVNDYYTAFVNAVARNRGVSVPFVKNSFGQGRVMGADAAVENKLVDRIGAAEKLISDLGPKSRGQAANAARVAILNAQRLGR